MASPGAKGQKQILPHSFRLHWGSSFKQKRGQSTQKQAHTTPFKTFLTRFGLLLELEIISSSFYISWKVKTFRILVLKGSEDDQKGSAMIKSFLAALLHPTASGHNNSTLESTRAWYSQLTFEARNQSGWSQAYGTDLESKLLGRQSRRIKSLWPAWITKWVQIQPGQLEESLSQKQKVEVAEG